MNKITINGVDVPLKFGYGLLRSLGEAWGCEGIVGVYSRFEKACAPFIKIFQESQKKAGDVAEVNVDISFESFDVFADVLHFSAKSAGADIKREDCADFLMENPETMGLLTQEFFASMPRPKEPEPGKQNPPIVPAGEA